MKEDPDYGKPCSLLIKNARLIGGLGTVRNDLQSIYIENGGIIGIGQNISVNDVRVLDVSGASVMPGLIDAHVHVSAYRGGKCIFLNTLTWNNPERCEPIINSITLK